MTIIRQLSGFAKYFTAILFGALLWTDSAIAQATLFEDTFDNERTGLGVTAMANWTVTAGDVDILGPGLANFYPGNGNYLDMDGFTSGTIESAPIRLGCGTHLLSFELGNNNFAGNGLQVDLGSVFSEFFPVADGRPPLMTFTRQFTVSIPITASLLFQETGPSDKGGTVLDDVKLQLVSPAATTIFKDTFDSEPRGLGVTAMANWTVIAGDIDVLGPGLANFYPGNGNYLDMDGFTSGTIESIPIALDRGTYLLSFEIGNNNFAGNGVQIEIGSVFSGFVPAPVGRPPLANVTLQFSVLTPTTASLVFRETGPSDKGGTVLDDIELFTLEPDPEDLTIELLAFIENLDLPSGTENALMAKLVNALVSLEEGNVAAALGQLGAFRNQVEAQAGKKIQAEDAQLMLDALDTAISGLDCS